MLSPYAVTCMRLHVSKKSAGGSGALLMTGRSQVARKRAWATALHIAGGHSFNTAVARLVLANSLGDITSYPIGVETRQKLWKAQKEKMGGLVRFRAHQSLENRSNSMVGSCMMTLMSGSLQIEAAWGRSSGSAGCSTMPCPSASAISRSAKSVNPSSAFPT